MQLFVASEYLLEPTLLSHGRRFFWEIYLSKIFRLMTKDDKSFLGGVSSKALLHRALDICSSEIFETRVLSRDMLSLFDDLTDVLSDIYKVFGGHLKDESAVTVHLLRWLDAMQPDGELDASLLPHGNLYRLSGYTNGEAVRPMCTKTAAVIKAKFASSAQTCDKYFMFPTRLDGADRERPEEKLINGLSGNRDGNRSLSGDNTSSEEAAKKKKKNKKNRKRGTATATPTASALPEADDGLAEMSTMLKKLLVSAGSEIGTNGDNTSVTCLEATLVKTASSLFSRLRNISVPAYRKAEDVHSACGLIQKLQRLVEEYSNPEGISTSARHARTTLFSEASHAIQMMHRFHRIDNKAIRNPALEPLRDLCGLTVVFVNFVVGTARIGISVHRSPQAREILDPLEKRIVKMPFRLRQLWGYRELVQTYSKARYAMGSDQTSSTDSFRSLEWYLTDRTDDSVLQSALDGMDGLPLYLDMVTTAFQDTVEFQRTINALPGTACYGDCVKHVVHGNCSKEGVAKAHNAVVQIAKHFGVQLSERSSKACTTVIRIGEFKFSAAGIVRKTIVA